jgi:hypothetical protein
MVVCAAMSNAGKVTLWIGVVLLCTVFGALVGINRKAVGRFIAGEQPEQLTASEAAQPHTARRAEAAVPERPAEPVIGWKPFKTETVELNPLDYRVLGTAQRPTRTKVTIQASTAVFFGVFPQSVLQEYANSRRLLRQNDFQQSKCGRVGIVETEFECDLEPGDALVLRDKRAEGSQLLGAFGLLRGNTDTANRATLGNKVHYEIAEWACVQNCR